MARELIHGVAVANFRGIGDQLQLIGPFQAVNFFLGPNNAGKSTILLFLSKYLNPPERSGRAEQWTRVFEPLDVRLGKNASEVRFGVAAKKGDLLDAVGNGLEPIAVPSSRKIIEAISDGEFVWMEPNEKRNGLKFVRMPEQQLLDNNEWLRLWRHFTNYTGGGSARENWIPDTLGRIAALATPALPQVAFIPAIREIGPKGDEYKDFSGKGLIDQLAEFQSPAHDEQHKKGVFEEINKFLRVVTQSPNAKIEIPFDRRHVLVHMDGRVLPISALGTGIQEVIMIAAFCTMQQGKVICIEEPEIHLHPLLQRRLMAHLLEHTSNQYFIATHSASLMDACPASIFKVSLVEAHTKIDLATTSIQKFEVCRELGYRASDILQANAVIWVEGPTDRIYLNHWLRAIDAKLKEGIDYSIMFYGGKLLSHLSASSEEVVDQFVSLLRLNRNSAILIDSDKTSASKPLNSTKERIISECAASFVWVTDGREIENYLGAAVVSTFLNEKYGNEFEFVGGTGKYGDRLAFKLKSEDRPRQVDKVQLAKSVVSAPADLSQLGLRRKIEDLVRFIRSAVA